MHHHATETHMHDCTSCYTRYITNTVDGGIKRVPTWKQKSHILQVVNWLHLIRNCAPSGCLMCTESTGIPFPLKQSCAEYVVVVVVAAVAVTVAVACLPPSQLPALGSQSPGTTQSSRTPCSRTICSEFSLAWMQTTHPWPSIACCCCYCCYYHPVASCFVPSLPLRSAVSYSQGRLSTHWSPDELFPRSHLPPLWMALWYCWDCLSSWWHSPPVGWFLPHIRVAVCSWQASHSTEGHHSQQFVLAQRRAPDNTNLLPMSALKFCIWATYP